MNILKRALVVLPLVFSQPSEVTQTDSFDPKEVTQTAAQIETLLNLETSENDLTFWDLDCPSNCISREKNEDTLRKVQDLFDPEYLEKLKLIQFLKGNGIKRARAHTKRFLNGPDDYVHIGVNPNWDNVDPTTNAPYFSDQSKTDLETHEYLHVLEGDLGIDMEEFYKRVKRWYVDPNTGNPSNSNSYKFTLKKNLYSEGMQYNSVYKKTVPGEEEFAYLGVQLATGKVPFGELPEEILEFYKGILHPDIIENYINFRKIIRTLDSYPKKLTDRANKASNEEFDTKFNYLSVFFIGRKGYTFGPPDYFGGSRVEVYKNGQAVISITAFQTGYTFLAADLGVKGKKYVPEHNEETGMSKWVTAAKINEYLNAIDADYDN